MGETERVEGLLAEGDASMRAGRFAEAQRAYREAWSRSKGVLEPSARVWILFAVAHSALVVGDFEEAVEACLSAYNTFASTGIVAGNPLFHLLLGLAYAGLGESEERALDHLTRALFCGGPDLFRGEDPRHLERLFGLLQPPSDTGSWEGYEGCSRDLLNGARGYLAELLTEKLGSPPPYTYE